QQFGVILARITRDSLATRRRWRRYLVDALLQHRLVQGRLRHHSSARSFAAHPRKVFSDSSFIGKNDSIRSSCTVISCGVPSVAIVVKSCSKTPSLRKCMGSTGVAATSVEHPCIAASTPA